MNQDQVKEKLLEIEKPSLDFKLTFSGKPSKKVNGLYEVKNNEIIIHNKNFEQDGKMNENLLMYTAIHEFAHHIQSLRGGFVKDCKHHNKEFKTIFNHLLKIAISKGIYKDDVFANQEFEELTKKLKNEYINKNATLMKEFGGLLGKAFELCTKYGARFEDYIERELQFNITDATVLMKAKALDIPTEMGLEKMKMVAKISNDDKRKEVQNALLEGEDIFSVKQELIDKPKPQDKKERLLQEKEDLKRRIAALERKLTQIESEIDTINDDQ